MDTITSYRLEGLAPRRKAAGFTQQELAERLGVSRVAVTTWETMVAVPRVGMLPVIAELLLCTVDDLYRAPAGNTPAAAAAAPFRQGGLEERADEELRFCAAGGGDSKSGISAAVGKPEDSVSPNGFPGTARRTIGPYEGTRTRAGDCISDAGSPSLQIIPDREDEDHAE